MPRWQSPSIRHWCRSVSRWSGWPWPSSKPTRDEMPVPVSSASAIIIYTIGTQTPDAVKANCPTSGIWAIQIRSTTLFSNINSCCNTTGTVIDTNSLRMGSVPNFWSVKIANNINLFAHELVKLLFVIFFYLFLFSLMLQRYANFSIPARENHPSMEIL